MHFFEKPKKKRDENDGVRWMRIQICWSLEFFLLNWSSVIDEGVITPYPFTVAFTNRIHWDELIHAKMGHAVSIFPPTLSGLKNLHTT
jgi:hypothetical protein